MVGPLDMKVLEFMSYSIICFIFLLGRSINYKTYQSRCVLSHQCLLLFVFEFPRFHVQVSQKLFLSQQESCCCIKLSNAQNVLVEKTLSTVFSTCLQTGTSYRKSVNAAGKNALKSLTLPYFKVVCSYWKLTEI